MFHRNSKSTQKAKVKSPRRKKSLNQSVVFTYSSIEEDIINEAKIIKLPIGSVRPYAKIVAEKIVSKFSEDEKGLTQRELDDQIAKELSRFNKDLSFVFKNRGKII